MSRQPATGNPAHSRGAFRRQDSSSSEDEFSHSLEHQECEIGEEVFTPDLERVEQTRLKQIVQTRSMLRGVQPGSDYQGTPDQLELSDQHFISREQIQCLHQEMSTVAQDMLDGATPTISVEAPPSEQSDGHDYINQAVVDLVLKEDGQNEATPTVEPKGDRISSSNGYNSRGMKTKASVRQQPVAAMNQENLGEFEKRLLLAKRKSKTSMPDMFEIPWYHPGISRHIAECLLVYKDIKDGTYLLRDCVSDANTVTLSVRCQKSVKHYKVVWDGKQFIFGLGKFNTLEEFKEHFVHQPVISGDSGVLVQLRFPYPRGVSEPAIYFEANVLTDVDPEEVEAKKKPSKKFSNSLDLSINSKEGYLTKVGQHRKNWKKRWFVLYKNEFKYFNCPGDKEPLRVINLEDVQSIDRDNTAGKPNCFRIVTPYRTFFMYATSEVEANEWVQILDWKLKQLSR